MKRNYYTLILVVLASLFCTSCKTPQEKKYWDNVDWSPESYKKDTQYFSDVNRTTVQNQQANRQNIAPECTLCHGKGRIVKNVPVETTDPDKMVKCKECKRKFKQSVGHTHVPCPLCRHN